MDDHLAVPESPRAITRRSLLLGGAAIAATAAGCSFSKGGAPNGADTVQITANSLRYPLTTEATTLDPATVQDGTTIDLLQNIYEGLVKWDTKNQIAPGVAEKWEVSPDGKTYTFHIRHGVKFHNGREVTADDFKYSLNRACNPATKSSTVSDYMTDISGASAVIAGTATEISGLEVPDPYTLKITIDAPKSYWLGNVTYPTFYAVCKEVIEKTGGALTDKSAIGCGPFKMAEFRSNYRVVLSANADYYAGRPKLDFVVRPVLLDANARLNNYAAGQLDLVEISPSDLDRVRADAKLNADIKRFSRASIWYVAMNEDAPNSPFKSRDVRRAFTMAINKSEIISIAMKNEVDPAPGIVPPGMAGYPYKAKVLPFDPAEARQLLAKAGFPGGKGFPALAISYRQEYPWVGNSAQLIASELKTNLGIDITLRPVEWSQFLNERTDKSMALSHLRWSADYLDPQDFLSLLLHTSKPTPGKPGPGDHPENGEGYSNPQFDQLCDAADVGSDAKKRMELYQQAEQIALDDAPWAPLYVERNLELISPKVGNISDCLLGHLPHLTTTVQP